MLGAGARLPAHCALALTADRHGALLFSRDRRATRVYAALGIRFELIA